MQTNARNLRLDVCDYTNKVICNLYDNQSNVSGQATNVFVTFERNGWKELSFDLPSVCISEEGQEENFRLQYLIADYRVRLEDDYGVDWYLISEPKITHDKFSKKISVTAGHISQLLKTKKLDLEFSDDEGNNVGTAEQLLTTILEGTGWHPGVVYHFVEKDNPQKEKIRSLVIGTKSGAFKMISEMCNLFDAKPFYHGDSKTVDILPMNPFSEEVNEAGIPVKVVDENIQVIELHYDKNVKNITRTLNTENIITKLFAYGSYGDREGLCSLQRCEHKEHDFTLTTQGIKEYVFSDGVAEYYFTTGTEARSGDTVIWSELDAASMSYVWNQNRSKVYRVYKEPKTVDRETLTATINTVRNYFSFIMDYSYYDKVGLLTDDKLQKIAEYQRTAPALLLSAEEASSEVIETMNDLSVAAEANTGFLKLNVKSYSTDSGYIKLVLDSDKPVLYRSDYTEPKRRQFSWYVAKELKDNGDPVSGIGSVVYAVNTNLSPARWRKSYVKKVNDTAEDYVYSANQTDDPTSLVLYLEANALNNSSFRVGETEFYLFCTNSNSGKLGVKESEAEALERTLQQTTKQVTEQHPTFFGWDSDPEPNTELVQNAYGWFYRSFRDSSSLGQLYFCYGLAGDSIWRRVYVSEQPPNPVAAAYYYNIRSKKLYHGESVTGTLKWVDIGDTGIVVPSHAKYYAPDAESQRLANNFSKVVFYCLKRDMLYKGIYERYIYTATERLLPGNYGIQDEYGFDWLFTTDKIVSVGQDITLDSSSNNVFQGAIDTDIVKAEIKSFDNIDFPSENELPNAVFNPGGINKTTQAEFISEDWVRSNNITLNYSTEYDYRLPENSYIMLYDSNRRFIDFENTSGTGSFTTTERVRYARLVCPSEPTSTHYLRVHDYLNRVFVSKKQYRILGTVNNNTVSCEGNRAGINELIVKMVEYSDDLYLNKIPAYLAVSKQILQKDNDLAEELGDLYREGSWQNDDYTEGDEHKLYADAKENLDKVAQPEKTYHFNFLDLYGSDQGVTTSDLPVADWPDIDISFAAHLVDTGIGTNEWAFIDKLKKCYDMPWKTELEINTDLSLISQHTFTDVLAHIADVANETKANQSVYKRAGNISGSGKIAATKLEGAIKANVTMLQGGSSNWYTDPKGNIILEAADGQSAMMLTGAGYMISSGKDKWGDWVWRSTMTGQGMTADAIYTGFLSGVLIEAGSITTDKLNASIGEELEIGSNKALSMFATVDGTKPAGSLQTTDAMIEIRAGYTSQGIDHPAAINIGSGGEISLGAGGKINIASEGELNLGSNGEMNIESGGTLTVKSDATIDIQSGSEFLVDSSNFKIIKQQDGSYAVTITGTIHSDTGDIAGFTMGKTRTRNYIYAGGDVSLDGENGGVYIGTDGINIGGGALLFSADGTTSKLKIAASDIILGQSSTLSSELSAAKSGISGAAISIDAENGVIDILAASSINIQSSKTLAITTAGLLKVGSTASPFTIGSAARDGNTPARSFIYNGPNSLTDTTMGIYVGTDGINLGGGNFVVNRLGELIARKGEIAGWTIDAGGIHRGNVYLATQNQIHDSSIMFSVGPMAGSGYYPFQIDNLGRMYASGGSFSGSVNATDGSFKGAVQATSLKIGAQTVDEWIAGKGFMLQANFDAFTVTYYQNDGILQNKTQYLQDNGEITMAAFSGSSAGSVSPIALLKEAGLIFDTNHKLTSENLSEDINNNLTKIAGISITSGRIDLTSLAAEVVAKDELDTALDGVDQEFTNRLLSYAQLSVLPDMISANVWNELGSASGIEITPTTVSIRSSGTFTVDAANFKVNGDGHVVIGSLATVDEDGHETDVYLNTVPLWKIVGGQTVTNVDETTGTITLSDKKTINFNNPSSISASWTGSTYTVKNKYSNVKLAETTIKLTTYVTPGNDGGPSFTVYHGTRPDEGFIASLPMTINYCLSNGAVTTNYTRFTFIKVGNISSGFQLNDYWDGAQNAITLSQGSWSNGATVVTAALSKTENNKTITVSIPAGDDSACEWLNPSGRQWRAKIVVGGASRYSTLQDFGFYFANGWSGCFDTVEIASNVSGNPSTINIDYNESITVFARAKQTESASLLTPCGSITVNGPSAPSYEPSEYRLNYTTAPSSYTVGAKVNGTWYTSGTVQATDAYNNGWSGAISDLNVPDTRILMDYGETVTVSYKASSSATPTVKTYTAPPDPGTPTVTYNYTPAEVGAQLWNNSDHKTTIAVNLNNMQASTFLINGMTLFNNAYAAGWNNALRACGIPNGGTVYTGSVRQLYHEDMAQFVNAVYPYTEFSVSKL